MYTAPSISDLFEFIFSYGIVVNSALSGEDILSGFNNTITNDLIIATKTIVINVLNETYPCLESSRKVRRRLNTATIKSQPKAKVINVNYPYVLETTKKRNLQSLSCQVYYTDDLPVRIINVISDDCNPPPTDPTSACSIVRSVVTIVIADPFLERDGVKNNMLQGLRQSFVDGSFLSALPP